MTLAGGFDDDGHGFGLDGGAVVGRQVDVERGVGRQARGYRDVYVAFCIQRVDRRIWLRGQPDRSCQLGLADAEAVVVTSAPSIIAAQAPMASAGRRRDLKTVLLLCRFVRLTGRQLTGSVDTALAASRTARPGTIFRPPRLVCDPLPVPKLVAPAVKVKALPVVSA